MFTDYNLKYLLLIISVQCIDKLKEGRTCLDKASVLYISVNYCHELGEAFLKHCIISEVYATVFKIQVILILYFSIKYLQNKKALGAESKEDENKNIREPISLQIGKKKQCFLQTAHLTVRRPLCGKDIYRTSRHLSEQTCLIRTLLDQIFYMCKAHRMPQESYWSLIQFMRDRKYFLSNELNFFLNLIKNSQNK